MTDDIAAAARAGDKAAFTTLVERHRGELRVHCYRMVGSLDEAEDLVQETFLRAWRRRKTYKGRSTFRAWLYGIATNACLDALDGRARRVLPHDLGPPAWRDRERGGLLWLQPFPDRLLEPVAPRDAEPDAVVITRETIELAFLAAIQHLPPSQRAVLILRDVLGWPARQVAELLDTSVPAANSALQRARGTLRAEMPERRLDWSASTAVSDEERAVLRRYMTAVERADLDAVAELLAADVRATMPPYPVWFQGRDAVVASLAASWDPDLPEFVGRFRMLETGANRSPAVAAYVRATGDTAYRPFAVGVVRVAGGRIAELTAFHDTALFAAFDLPTELPADR